MTPEKALEILDQARKAVSTNWESHMALAEAIRVLSELVARAKGQ